MKKQINTPFKWTMHESPFASDKFYQLLDSDGNIICDDGSNSGQQAQMCDPETFEGKLIAASGELYEAVHLLLQVIAGVADDDKQALWFAKNTLQKVEL